MKLWLIGLSLISTTVPTHSQESRQTIVDDAWQGAQGYHFSGRLTEIRPAPAQNGSRLSALYRNTRMLFTSGEHGLVTWRVDDNEWTMRVDERGFWELAGSQTLDLKPGWYDIDAEPSASSAAGFLAVDPSNQIGIISDIDDTILITGVLSKPTLLKNSLTVTPENREAVPGMAELYQQLSLKNPAPETTAIFYLSSSPRQLTDNLRRFLSANKFPRGVLQLRKTGGEDSDSTDDHLANKLRHVEMILAAFPQLHFHCFGDDAESDPEIYAQIQAKYPRQIAGVWIRHLKRDEPRATFPDQRDVSELIPLRK